MNNILYFAIYNICRKKYRTLYIHVHVILEKFGKLEKRNEKTKRKFEKHPILAMELIVETRKNSKRGKIEKSYFIDI